MSEQRCVRGHGVPAGFRFCGICDGPLAAARAPAFAGVASGTQPSRPFAAAPAFAAPAGLAPAPVAAPRPPEREHDPWLRHFLRFFGVNMAVGATCYLLVGFVWIAHICNRTGARRRDLLSLFVPLVGPVFHTRAVWRYTARHVYWTPRSDRPSDVFRGAAVPWSIAGGWVATAVFAGVLAFTLGAGGGAGWSDTDREGMMQIWMQEGGIDRATAECMADEVIRDLPDANAEYPEPVVERVVENALFACIPPGS